MQSFYGICLRQNALLSIECVVDGDQHHVIYAIEHGDLPPLSSVVRPIKTAPLAHCEKIFT